MSDRVQKYSAPIIVLIVILILWESLVAILQIEQFLLPRPSVIASNFIRFVTLVPNAPVEDEDELKTQLRARQLFVSIPKDTPQELLEPVFENTLGWFSLSGRTVMVVRGTNLTPLIQSSLFTLREALGGFVLGSTAGFLTALITARWTTTREALMPFAIAANSMPIIAFAPIMNNWFGIDNPFSKMAIVSIMIFFPMMINTVRGLILVDPRSLELMRSYAATEFDILFKLRIPNSLPYLFNGFKVAAALSMIGAIVGEYFGGPRISLGVFITQEAALFRFSSAWAAIILACIIGIALYLIILVAERLAMPWHVSLR